MPYFDGSLKFDLKICVYKNLLLQMGRMNGVLHYYIGRTGWVDLVP